MHGHTIVATISAEILRRIVDAQTDDGTVCLFESVHIIGRSLVEVPEQIFPPWICADPQMVKSYVMLAENNCIGALHFADNDTDLALAQTTLHLRYLSSLEE